MLRCFIFVVIAIITDVARGSTPQLVLHKVLAEWSDAQLRCQAEGGRLAIPNDSESINAMRSLMKNNKMYHIGIKEGYIPGTYVSVEGKPLENMTEAYNMIEELNPNDGDCMAMDHINIHLIPCSMGLQYICTTTKITRDLTNCGPPENGYMYIPSSRKCYKLVKLVFDWYTASATCTAEGGQLAVVRNEIDKQNIANLTDWAEFFWIFIGLRDGTGRGDWRSVDGQHVNNLYNAWEGGRMPINSNKICGSLHKSGLLNNLVCSDSRYFVCEKEPTA